MEEEDGHEAPPLADEAPPLADEAPPLTDELVADSCPERNSYFCLCLFKE